MSNIIVLVLLNWCARATWAYYCYNCTATQKSSIGCSGHFAVPLFSFNSTRMNLVNCTGDNAMCFVRAWRARSRHAWIVQRGCYYTREDDPLPKAVDTPTRSMTCTRVRLPEAEYKVCLCKADWCNTSIRNVATKIAILMVTAFGVIT